MLQHFKKLTQLLTKYETVWKEDIFKAPEATQLTRYPSLNHFLSSLSDTELHTLQTDDHLLFSASNPHFPDAVQLEQLTSIKYFTKEEQHPPHFWNTDIPGRKADQILAFSQAIGKINSPILEWCCGKQHLGRLLSQLNQQPSDGLEIDHDLVNKATLLSQKQKVAQTVITHECNVLSLEALHFLKPKQHAVALHACGGLHVRLLEACIEQNVEHIYLSPCCYHRFNRSKDYLPLSNAAQKSKLTLHENDLRLAVRETKTASLAETQHRRCLQAWRLGFDSLQREIRYEDTYLELPSLPPTILKESFQCFCERAASMKGLNLPKVIDFKRYEALGLRRLHSYEKAELFRMLFRRALETWLVLDKAIYLEEHGYQVELGLFCSSDVTPRNLLIKAKLTNPRARS